MFNCQNESQFISFKERILNLFTQKMIAIVKSMNKQINTDFTLCEAISRAQFEGFTYIVKTNIDDVDLLKKNLEIYEKLMIEHLGKKVMEVVKK